MPFGVWKQCTLFLSFPFPPSAQQFGFFPMSATTCGLLDDNKIGKHSAPLNVQLRSFLILPKLCQLTCGASQYAFA